MSIKRLLLLPLCLLLLSICVLGTSPLQAKPQNIKPSNYIFLDFKGPKISFEFILQNRLTLEGFYNKDTATLKLTSDLNNIELTNWIKPLKDFGLKKLFIKKGDLALTKDKIYTLRLNLIAQDSLFSKENIKLQGDLSVSGFINLPLTNFDNLKTLNLKNILSGKDKYDYAFTYKLANAKLYDLSKINVNGDLKNGILTLDKGAFIYNDIAFTVNGKLENFLTPNIILAIKVKDLTLKAEADYNQHILAIKKLDLKGPNTNISSQVDIDTLTSLAKIKGQGHLDLKDATTLINWLIPNYRSLNKLDPDGIFQLNFIAQTAENFSNWQINLDAFSQKLKIYNIETKNIKIKLLKDKHSLALNPLLADINNGKLRINSLFNLASGEILTNLTANDIDIEGLKKQLNLKKNYSGKLSFAANIKIPKTLGLSGLEGKGEISIVQGNIWQIDFLKGLGEFLFIPDFEGIVFKDGSSDIFFKNNNVIFENIQLSSLQMKLEGGGKISYHGNLSFLLFPQFNNNLINASEGLKKYLTAILGNNALAIEVTGNTKKPKYKIKPLFLTPLKGIETFFKDLLDH